MLQAGDVITKQDSAGWRAVKILAVDAWPDGTFCAHCLNYRTLAAKPTLEALRTAEVQVWHAPIAAESFLREDWEQVGNQPPTQEEFVGFFEYLKLTDFPRYLKVTGQDVKQIVGKANEHYRRACKLGDENRREEAIAEYTEAIELFPLFFEAIDNRAFTFMELGQNREALHDFEESLRVNPDGLAAFFSRGECLMKLGELDKAEEIFVEGYKRFPDQQKMFADFRDRVRQLKNLEAMKARRPK